MLCPSCERNTYLLLYNWHDQLSVAKVRAHTMEEAAKVVTWKGAGPVYGYIEIDTDDLVGGYQFKWLAGAPKRLQDATAVCMMQALEG